MIWDIIRDFIVQHITGGHTSDFIGYDTMLGIGMYTDTSEGSDSLGNSFMLPINGYIEGSGEINYICFSDWLATTLTAVIMVLLVVALVLLVRWVFKAVVNAFTLR